MTACTVQGMARVRSGQACPCPVVSGRSVRRGSGVKRDFACTCTRHFPPVLVVLRSQSRLRLEGRTRTLSGPSPDLSPARPLAPSARRRELLIRRYPCGHPGPFGSVRDLVRVPVGGSCEPGESARSFVRVAPSVAPGGARRLVPWRPGGGHHFRGCTGCADRYYCPAQTPPPNTTAAGPYGRRVLSGVGVADHAVTPGCGLGRVAEVVTGSGWGLPQWRMTQRSGLEADKEGRRSEPDGTADSNTWCARGIGTCQN